MATHDYAIANASGSSVRSDLNNALAAIVSNNSSSSEPSTKYAYMLWVDTTNNLIKLRNSANNAWITLFTTAGGLDVDAASNFNEDVTFTGASANVTWDKSVDDFIFNDNAKAVFGTSSDGLALYHDGSNSYINESGTGDLIIDSSHIVFKDGGTEVFETTNSGARFKDSKKLLFGNGNDLEIFHDGSHSYIKDVGTGSLRIDSDSGVLLNTPNFTVNNSDNSESIITAYANGAVELWFNNDLKFTTTDTGCKVRNTANGSESSPHLQIQGSGYAGMHWLDGTAYYIGHNSPSRSLRLYANDETAYVQLAAGGNSWTSSSDERLKEDIQDIGSVIDKVKDIRCISYKRKNLEGAKETIGFIAQDFVGKFDQVLDQSITIKDDDTEYYGIKYTETIPILLKAIQELSAEVETLKTKVAAL